MQQWEYLDVSYTDPHGAHKVGEGWLANGKPLGLEHKDLDYRNLNELGRQGWELVSAVHTQYGDVTRYVFKRPKQ